MWRVRSSAQVIPWHGGRAGRLSQVSKGSLRVVLLGVNYAPEPTGIAPYTTGIAAGLAKRGHDVAVMTGLPHYPYWRRNETYSKFRSDEVIDDVKVRRLMHSVPQRLSWGSRAVMEITFGLQLLTTRWGSPDVVICVTPPLLATLMSTIRARMMWRRPSVGILVQDMYGRGIAEMGAASGVTASTVRASEALAIRLSDGVSVIHSTFAQDLVSDLNVDGNRIRHIRNWTHVGSPDRTASTKFRKARGWSDSEIVVLHAGNMGYKQGLENVVAAARIANQTNKPIRFVLLGDGNQRTALERLAAGLPELEFLPPVTEEEFPAALGAADVLLVNERPGVAHMSVPSKLTSYFNSGKPVLAATDAAGTTASELESSGAGVCVPAGRPDLLLLEALRLGSDRDLAGRLGESGLQYCSQLLSEEHALDSYEQWIVDLANLRGLRRWRGRYQKKRIPRRLVT